MASRPIPHPKNVQGPFYVENGCCLSCDIPVSEAPGHFEYDDDFHCYVSRQPSTEDETTKMVRVALGAELQCIRYRGTDPDVLHRLAELDLRDICDNEPPLHIKPVVRNHVQVTVLGTPATETSEQLLEEFINHVVSKRNDFQHFKAKAIEVSDESSSTEISWYADNFHPVILAAVPGSANQWHIEYPLKNELGDRGVGSLISEWLMSNSERFTNIRWYTAGDWHAGGPSKTTLW